MILEQRSGPRVERWDLETQTYESWLHGALDETRTFTDDELRWLLTHQQEVVRADRLAAAARGLRLAYAANRAYLDKVDAGTAVAADHVQQTARLTRQLQALVRLVAATTLTEEGELDPLPGLPPVVTGTPGPTGLPSGT
jgi:hypothetical protein